VGERHDQVVEIMEATRPDVAVAVLDADDDLRVLAERMPRNPAGAKIHVLGMKPPPGSVTDGPPEPSLGRSEADPPAPPGSTHPDPKPPRGQPS
jgi:hypothetical protein